jgi:hypothetical protein
MHDLAAAVDRDDAAFAVHCRQLLDDDFVHGRASVRPPKRMRAQISCATAARMNTSPWPVADTAQQRLSA